MRPKRHVPRCFVSVPMATLCDFVTVAQGMATQDREVCCLPHEFHAMESTVRARWAAQLPRTRSHLAHANWLSFTVPTALHCPAPEIPHRTTATPRKVICPGSCVHTNNTRNRVCCVLHTLRQGGWDGMGMCPAPILTWPEAPGSETLWLTCHGVAGSPALDSGVTGHR